MTWTISMWVGWLTSPTPAESMNFSWPCFSTSLISSQSGSFGQRQPSYPPPELDEREKGNNKMCWGGFAIFVDRLDEVDLANVWRALCRTKKGIINTSPRLAHAGKVSMLGSTCRRDHSSSLLRLSTSSLSTPCAPLPVYRWLQPTFHPRETRKTWEWHIRNLPYPEVNRTKVTHIKRLYLLVNLALITSTLRKSVSRFTTQHASIEAQQPHHPAVHRHVCLSLRLRAGNLQP